MRHSKGVAGRGDVVKPFKRICPEKNRERWLEARRRLGIGASESAVIMGLSPYESTYTLYHRRKGNLPPLEDNEPMEWGRRLEKVVAGKFAEETGRRVFGGGWLLQSRAHPWLIATPDRNQEAARRGVGLLEIKTANQHAAEDWEGEPPPHYQCQLQHQLLVTGLRWGSLACLIGGQQFVWADTKRHDAFLRILVRKTRAFKHLLDHDIEPEPDDSVSTSETIRRLIEDGMCIELPDLVLQWHEERLRAAEDEKAARERKEEYERKIVAMMGHASHGVLPAPGLPFGSNGIYKLKTEHRKEYTVPASSKRRLRYSTRLKL